MPEHNRIPYIGPAIQNGAPVRLARCPTLATKWGTDDTLWYPLPDGQIYNQGNGLCLENPGSATARAAKLVMEPCYGSAGEIWAEG